ncbi:MAG: hypothetical protein CBC38_05470 [Gammaproteobacteria bacterium TMED78]|nr:MAG: hypothetical protein CBC38_05470 [Gammaproteobacteria bacterium TMED78]|tara:strand:+ start:77452 stop:78204 length:753 start_codon:yes stop_codon:yes gene_type:complete
MNISLLKHKLVLIFSIFLVSEKLISQDSVTEPLEKKYKIEVLIFDYNDFDPNEEYFDMEKSGSLLDLLSENILKTQTKRSSYIINNIIYSLKEVGYVFDQNSTYNLYPPITNNSYWFRLLKSEELSLLGILNRLNTLDVYTPISYGAWIQEAYPETDSYIFDLYFLGSMNPLGKIHFYESRFLHLDINIDYSTKYSNNYSSNELRKIQLPRIYNLKTDKIVRNGEINYFDHPAFGVIVLVEEYSDLYLNN